MKLAELLTGFVDVEQDIEFTHIALDSREITVGGVFFALSGNQQHGMQFSDQVIQQGAVAIIYDPETLHLNLAGNINTLPVYAVENLADKLGVIAAQFYANPSVALSVIGITGTNGKTSCSHFLAQAMDESAVIGTLGWGLCNALQSTKNTTPDAFKVQKMLADLLELGVKNVAMEVSSHGLVQGRVNSTHFQGVIFNNLSRDHLDYHLNMEAYFQAKLLLVKWPGLKFVVVNLDDAYAERVLQVIPQGVRKLTYSLRNKIYQKGSSLCVSGMQYSMQGIKCDVSWGEQQAPMEVSLLGDFNLQNVSAVLAAMLAMGKPFLECLQSIRSIRPVIGRMECFRSGNDMPLVVVDYAHTPDALSKVLKTLRRHCQGKLTLVFGCGGDRDKGKRGEMGKLAEQLADEIIVTDDNPRFESSEKIINDIIAKLSRNKICVINERKSAIHHAILNSQQQDVVLIAGKGHEDYQDIKGVKLPFSDRDCVQEFLT